MGRGKLALTISSSSKENPKPPSLRKNINLCKISPLKINERRKHACLKILEFEFSFSSLYIDYMGG